eukprot:6203199-Pleurochrysis_carterae.AAC.4
MTSSACIRQPLVERAGLMVHGFLANAKGRDPGEGSREGWRGKIIGKGDKKMKGGVRRDGGWRTHRTRETGAVDTPSQGWKQLGGNLSQIVHARRICRTCSSSRTSSLAASAYLADDFCILSATARLDPSAPAEIPSAVIPPDAPSVIASALSFARREPASSSFLFSNASHTVEKCPQLRGHKRSIGPVQVLRAVIFSNAPEASLAFSLTRGRSADRRSEVCQNHARSSERSGFAQKL